MDHRRQKSLLTKSISVKLVRELLRIKWSLALKACPLCFLASSPLFDPSAAVVLALEASDRSDLERIFDCTKVLKVLNPVLWWWSRWIGFSAWLIDFFRCCSDDPVDILELRLTLVWSDDKSLPSFFWSEEPRLLWPLQVVTSILGMGSELLRFLGGGSVVMPHVIPFSLKWSEEGFSKVYWVQDDRTLQILLKRTRLNCTRKRFITIFGHLDIGTFWLQDDWASRHKFWDQKVLNRITFLAFMYVLYSTSSKREIVLHSGRFSI